MAAVLGQAITAPKGLEAFDRIMLQPHLVQAVPSSPVQKTLAKVVSELF